MVRISRFSPWQTPKDQLEAIFVTREPILDNLVKRVLNAAASDSRQHTLIVGPRGSGKTHLLAMLYYQLQDALSQGIKIQIARLPEDPFTIVSYTRLLSAIFTSVEPDQTVDMNADALEFMLDQMAEKAGPIVVLLENLDEVFAQIGIDGQRKLRHYLQTSNTLLMITTTSILDRSINDQASPFYSYFSVIRLQELSAEQAQQMLLNIASVQENTELVDYLSSDHVLRRLNIVRYLAGSHPRIWSIFSEVMTPNSLQRIAELLYASFDDLTPYYRDRLMSLNPQQRLVVSELAVASYPLHVQEISQRTHLGARSVARTVIELKDAGWIKPVETLWAHLLDGRRTYYELCEPLVRLAFQVKDAVDKPISLIVNFLTLWLDPEEIESWGGNGLVMKYLEQVETSFSSDANLRFMRRLTRLPACKADDTDLLGKVDDALSQLQSGDASALMALPSLVRIVLELQCQELSPDAEYNPAPLRRELHHDAMNYMGWVAHEPQSSEWISRGENLAQTTGAEEDFSIWAEWLARSGQFDQAETVMLLLSDDWLLMSRDNLALAYQSAGRFKEAIHLLEQNLADFERILGPDHPNTLTLRNNLASVYESLGDYDRAIPIYEQTLADREQVLGPDHPDTLTSRNSLAGIYISLGDYDRAIPIYEQTLADRERVLGPDHPNTLTSRNNLAFAYRSLGDYDRAIPIFKLTLADRERVLGPDHPNTLTSRNNLASAYESLGDYDRAIPIYEQNLADSERILGPDHPDTLVSRNNLASAYRSLGDYNRALPILEQNLADSERVLGPDHPITLASRNNLAGAYRSLGDYDRAIPICEQNLADSKRVLGPDHPNTLASRNNLASAYENLGDYYRAIPIYEQTLAGFERILGPDHPNTLTSRNNLASAYESLGDYKRAIPIFEQTLADRERVLGPDHPDTKASRNNLERAKKNKDN